MKSEPAYGTPILSRTAYIHTTARTRDISIVPSSACCGNNSTGATRHDALYWSSLRARLQRKPGQGSPPLSFFLWLEPPIYFSFFSARLRFGPDGSTRIQLPRQNRDRSSIREVVAIYINSRRWSRALMINTRLPWSGSHGQTFVIDIFLFETMLLGDFRLQNCEKLLKQQRVRHQEFSQAL